MEEPLKARPTNLFLSNKVDENNNNNNKNPVQVQEVQSPFLVDFNNFSNNNNNNNNQMNFQLQSQNLLQGQNSNNSFFSNQNKQGSAVKGLDTVFSFNFDNVQPSSHLSIQKSENQVKNFNLQENNSNSNNNYNQSKFVIQQQPPSFKFQQKFQIQTSRKSSLNLDLFGQNNDFEQNLKSLKQIEDENIEKYFQQENDKNDLSFDECMFREYQQSFNNQNNNLQKQQQFQFFNQETDFEFKIESQVQNTNQNQLFVKQEQTLTNFNNNNNSQIFQQQGVEEQENNLEIEFPPLDISNEQQEEDTETQSNQNINNHKNTINTINFDNNQEIFSSQNNENFNTSSTTLNTYTNFNEQEYDNQGKKIGNQMENIWKINEKKIAKNKKKQRDYDKNICRYLARQVIRCFVDSVYKEDVVKFCQEELEFQKNKIQKENNYNKNNNIDNNKNLSLEDLYQSAKLFLLGKIEFVTGHRAFQDLLICREEEEKYLEKNVFKRFAYWFLKYRALRYIINGAMSDKKGYLQFKNQIMLHYVQKPETWNANLAKKSKRKPKIFRIELA